MAENKNLIDIIKDSLSVMGVTIQHIESLIPIQKDITNDFKTRQWTAQDTAKKVVIVFQKDGAQNNRVTGFIDSIGEGHVSTGGCHISLGDEYKSAGVVWTYFYNTLERDWVGLKIVSSHGGVTNISIDPTHKPVLEFHIWED